jgi:proteasome assembly chaperone (PAC2) family protein
VEHVRLDRRPTLRDPVAVVAFAGWGDAAGAATNAARFVVRRLGARRFASIDAEPFYDFTETRPVVRIDAQGTREVTWPSNDFFYARNPIGTHDVVVAVGVEPNMRWRTFADAYRSLLKDVGVTMAVSLGALMADVPHTRDIRVTGSAADQAVAARLDLAVSRYQGPTGILGILGDGFRRDGVPSVSLWANVPHYVTTNQNPPATMALLRRLESLLDLEFDYSELRTATARFIEEVNTAVSGNSEIGEYVRRLEDSFDSGAPLPASLDQPDGDLLLDIEEFLRDQRPEE